MSRTTLPKGWTVAKIEEIADTALGKMLDKGQATGQHPVPYLRNINVQWGRISLADVAIMDIAPTEQEFFRLKEGDLLACEGGEIGRCAIWNGSGGYMAFQKALHRIRPKGAVDVRYLRYFLEYSASSGRLAKFATGSTIKHLSQRRLREIPVPVPPLEEQHRIVESLEDHLSRLDAAVRELKSAHKKIVAFRKSVLLGLVPETAPTFWKVTTTGEAGTVELGRQRHPDWHHGSNMRPYLRVANVFEDRIDISDVMEMDFSDVFEKYRLEPGDVLLNEGQSPHLVGRPALYRGTPPDVAYTNSLLRFRAGPDVLPEWALMVFRRHMHARRFMREVRITTNIAHLSSKRLKSVEFPIPPLDEQKKLVKVCDELMSNADAMERTVERSRMRANHLRSSLLDRAFTGALVRQDPDEEPASALLERIEAERKAMSGAPGRARRTARGPRQSTGEAPPPPIATVPVPATAVQQELPL